ncbi:MAG: ABC transporter permease [Pirellulaceae bacterium]|nr:ABC transporter permease [Pirellulaceae bacterium]MDP7019846.1 ABC transporter permease [Pirellulaceae bacterium]
MSTETVQRDEEHYERLLAEAAAVRGVSLRQDAWRRLRKNRVAMFSLWTIAVISVSAFLTPFLPLQGPRFVDTSRAFQPPTLTESASIDRDRLEVQFGELGFFNRQLLNARLAVFGEWAIPSICGTDELGRDLLARLFWGARISLIVGIVATLVSLVIGVSYGATSGFLGGNIDNLMMRIIDVAYSVPFIFVVIFILTILNADANRAWMESAGIDQIFVFFIVVGAIYWLTMARVVRGQVISLKNEQFVEAARTIGANRARIIFIHLVPNLLSVVIVYLTLTIPRVMLFEAFLSFLGLGVEAPDVSWGVLANTGFKVITPIRVYWWLITFPGIALGVTLFALNFLGDGLRDAFDPRLKNR